MVSLWLEVSDGDLMSGQMIGDIQQLGRPQFVKELEGRLKKLGLLYTTDHLTYSNELITELLEPKD